MPTRKQRRREAKSKRHEYEFVYVDSEGHEVEDPPEETAETPKRRESANGAKPDAKAKGKQQPQQRGRGGRAVRVPQPPSWQRAARRALILGAVVFVLFSFGAKGSGSSRYATALLLTAVYTVLFIPFTYFIDRYAYRRWQAREAQQATKKR